MKVYSRVIVGLILAGFGCVLLLAGLFSLGWMRHGKSPSDLDFLHLDWTWKTGLPYWSVHMANLAFVIVGIGFVIGSAMMILRSYLLQRTRK